MKKYLLLAPLLLAFTLSFGQLSLSMATGGTPVVPAGWLTGGSASTVSTWVQLTPPSGSQAGRVYYGTPVSLTGCGAFTAEFEFQIIPSTSSWAIADGLAFWIVNPLSGFVGGGGIGLPTNPNGLVLILDSYDNDGVANDPLVSLYGYPSGFTGTYTEGSATNRIGSLSNQNFVTDGGWHHVKLTYSGGNVKVYFNHNAVPGITGYFPIGTSGYFGFCGSTGGAWSTQSVRNVYIYSDAVSSVWGPDVVCMGTTGVYTDSTSGGTWSSSTPAVGTISTTGVLTPISAGTTTVSYTYSGTCYATKVVTVSATTLTPISTPASLCSSSSTTLTGSPTGGTWGSSATYVATIGSSSGVVTPVRAGTSIITYTLPVGCYDTAILSITTAPPTMTISPTPAVVCDNGALTLTAAGSSTYNLFPPQSWEHGMPNTSGVPVDLWTTGATGTYFWYPVDGSFTATPATSAAASGTYVGNFNCRSIPSGASAYLYSPNFSMVGVSSATFSVWVYRDATAYNTTTYNSEGLYAYVTSPTSGSTYIGMIPRRAGAAVLGSFTGTSTTTTSGWYQYTYTLPASYTTANNQIYMYGYSQNGDNLYIDSITLVGTIGPPTWSPTTWLYNDAGLTIPYTGAAQNPVYMHPTGVSSPTNITYTASLSNGTCSSTGTVDVTVNPNPAAITGTMVLCTTSSVTLADATAGGTWSSSNPAVASVVSSTGVVTGNTIGTATISYGFAGCFATTVVTVVSSPAAITGTNIACLGSTTTLANSVAGGTWSSSNPAVGTVDATTGVVTGVSVGTTYITYGIATCYSTLLVSVNPYPAAITGALGVCIGSSTTLSSSPSGGLWTSGSPVVATVGVLTGVVTGGSAGTAVISYRLNGCAVTTTVNVVTTPGPITGSLSTCVGSTATATHATPGGTWSTSTTTVATVNPTSGLITGVGVGTTRLTYTVSAGCYATAIVTVTVAPSAPTGTMVLCPGTTTTLSHSISGGTWSCACPTIASVGIGTGVVSGIAPGTCIITYTPPSGCIAMATVTVNAPPAPITGPSSLCAGSSGTLTTTTSVSSWASSSPVIATISSTGVVTGISAGVATFYCPAIIGPGVCTTSYTMTINPLPGPITGTTSVCTGQTTVLSCSTPGGTWSSSTPAVGTISSTGTFSGLGSGTSVISYTTGAGCSSTTVVTVNGSTAPILGPTAMCVGGTLTLTCATSGVIWTSSNPGVASVLSPGFIGGVSPGTATISCTASTGCPSTLVVTVNTLPGTIGGPSGVCVGSTITLTNSVAGGTWSNSPTATASIDFSTGVLTGASAGTTSVTYSLGSGCITTTTITINTQPTAISGTQVLCQGASATLSSTPTGGTWTSDNTAVATIGSSTGTWNAVSAGTATISYTLASGCLRTTVVTVNALPGAISGLSAVCVGQCITFTTTGTGGAWSSSNPAAGTIGSTTGTLCGIAGGSTNVVYTLPSGCSRSTAVLVNALPTAISGSTSICAGACATLTGTPSGGTWSSGSTSIATVTLGGGSLCGVIAGTANITYTSTAGCYISTIATVNSAPAAITGGSSTCIGQCIALSSATPGGTWSSSTPATGSINSSTGNFCGVSAGTTTVTYTSSASCPRTAVITVNALPSIITGAPIVCVGSTTTLNSTPTGGTWSSDAPLTAGPSVATSGIITGNAPGTATISYTAGTGCVRSTVVTVNDLPSAIGGTLTTCVGSTTTLTNSTAGGGTWSASPTSVAIISSGGTVTGMGAGTATITFTSSTTTCRTTAVVTVYALPGSIGGTLNACEGQCTPLSNSATGGTWMSSNTAVGTIDATSGMLCGITTGTTNVTYTLGTGCFTSATVTVNPVPAPITGMAQVCIGMTTTLSTISTGGAWGTGSATIATVSSTGVVTGGSTAGTVLISYTYPTGCRSTIPVTVNPLPTGITGPSFVCEGAMVTVSSSTSGGVWSSPHATISIDATTGVVTGVSAGTATISYTAGAGCVTSRDITINPLPNSITGSLGICIGDSSLLATTSSGGIWSSSNPAVATISSTGMVVSHSVGTTQISYTFTSTTGCARVADVTVNGLPSAISGPSGFCNLSTAVYSSMPLGGTWSSSNTSVLTVDASGNATGVSVDTAYLTYTLGTGCSVSKKVFLILAPYPITGPDAICVGQSTTLGNVITGGTWISSNPSVAPINTTGGVVGMAVGTSNITYTLSTGCASYLNMTVNPVPSGIVGPGEVCENSSISLSNTTPGGTWTSGSPATATIDLTSGLVTGYSAGTVNITYALSSGCNAIRTETVNPLPAPITGTPEVCEGTTTYLASATAGGTWAAFDPAVAYADPVTGSVLGISATTPGMLGPGQTIIRYTLSTGCLREVNFTVDPLPTANTGLTDICIGTTTSISNATPGGAWTSSNPTVATIDGVTGVATGIAAGHTTISYVLPTGCIATSPLDVHANPDPIGGSLTVCAGFATNLIGSPSGGTWSQEPTSMMYGTINTVTGVVSAITAGTIPVTYTLMSGCYITDTVTVINLPSVIGGVAAVCEGSQVTLTHPTAGGTWSSSNPARASIDPVTGTVTGVSAGTVVMTYAISTGCFNVRTVTVNPLPAPITGPLQICAGSVSLLHTATAGGVWVSYNTAVAPITPTGTTGVVTGVSAGTAPIDYIIGATGCLRSVEMTVNATPTAILTNGHICISGPTTFADTSAGGLWYSSNPSVATIGLTTGVATPVSLGTTIISYVYPATGCMAQIVATVHPLPTVYNVTGGGSYCSGGNGDTVGLSGSQAGVSYVLYNGSMATGYLTGTGFSLNFGLHTAAGTYTVEATHAVSGCRNNMAGSATINILPLVTPMVSVSATPGDSVCPGQTVLASPVAVNGGTAPTYVWKVNGVTVGSGGSYSFLPSDGDVVSVTMTTNVQCPASPTATGSATIHVLPSALPVAGVDISPNDTVCQYSTVTLTAMPVWGGAHPTYTWYVNGSSQGSGDSYSFNPDNGDVVTLQMTSDYLCRTATTVTSGAITISVDPLLLPHVTIYPEPGLSVTAGVPVTLHAVATDAGASPGYQWKVNGYPVAGATNDTYTAVFHDYDSVACAIVSSGVCGNIGSSDWVYISTWSLGTATNVKATNLQLLPNPNKGVFTIKGTLGTSQDEVAAEVTDMLGRTIYHGKVQVRQGNVDAIIRLDNNLANGMYILTLKTETGSNTFHFVMEQ